MVKEDHVYQKAKIKYKGVLDIYLMYSKINEWLGDEDFKVKEDMYVERVKPDGKAIEFQWTCTQDKDKYISWKAILTFYITGVKDVEVEQEGRKLKLQQCTVEITFNAWNITNAKDEFKEDSLIKKIYEKFIVGKKIEEEKDLLFMKMQELVSELKTFLALYEA